MIDESKLIFYTGAPGCKWSALAHILTHSPLLDVNTSDYSEERMYTHTETGFPGISHQGAYWGPGNDVGCNFHRLDELSKDEIVSEIEKPYADKNWDQYRIIKCHQFALNLEFIKTTFPKSKIIMVLRDDYICYSAWMNAGGFEKITYPNYSEYYKDPDTIKMKIAQENLSTRSFITANDLHIDVAREKYFKDRWGISKTNTELSNYITSIEGKPDKKIDFRYTLDITVSEYNF